MNTKFVLTAAIVAALAATAGAAPQKAAKPKPRKIADIVKEEVGQTTWARRNYGDIIDDLLKLRQRPDIATNATECAYIDLRALELTVRPGWTRIKYWDTSLREYIPTLALRNLYNVKGVRHSDKLRFVKYLVSYYCGEERWQDAKDVIAKAIASVDGKDAKKSASQKAEFKFELANVARWQDDYAGAWKVLDEVAEYHPVPVARFAAMLSDEETGGPEKAAKFFKKVSLPAEVERYFVRSKLKKPADIYERAYKYVADKSNRAETRFDVSIKVFGNSNDELARKARAAIADIDKTKLGRGYYFNEIFKSAYCYGDWEFVRNLYESYDGAADLKKAEMQRIKMISLQMGGYNAEAIAVAKAGSVNKEDGFTDLDRAKFAASLAMLEGKDVFKAIDSAKLERKDMISLVTTAGRQAVTWSMNDYSEALSKKYSSYFVQFPQRELKVAWSDTPVASISDWRAIYPKLEKQYCDRKWGARVDILETDVATGRQLLGKTENDSENVRMEITSVCDAKGLSIFLRVEDPKARDVEAGFANGIGTEMYFAPGKYEPYVCFSSSPRGGVNDAFQTLYDSIETDRVDFSGKLRKGEFVSETAFTDNDYVLRMFIGWDRLAKRLPSKGKPWRFECIAFTPAGNFSWGGSEGVHNSSCWGDLVFDFTPAQLTAIRKGIILREVKTWRNPRGMRLDIFDMWADSEIGDPAFYKAELKPLEEKLAGYAKKVKPGMTDADVNEIFENALPRWVGIVHEIDAKRRNYLKCAFTE